MFYRLEKQFLLAILFINKIVAQKKNKNNHWFWCIGYSGPFVPEPNTEKAIALFYAEFKSACLHYSALHCARRYYLYQTELSQLILCYSYYM